MHRSIERDVLYVLLTYWLRRLRSREEDRSIESSRVESTPSHTSLDLPCGFSASASGSPGPAQPKSFTHYYSHNLASS